MNIEACSQRGKELIIKYECSGHPEKFLNAYLCPAGKWTIGIGSTRIFGRNVKEGDKITLQQAYDQFHIDLESIKTDIDLCVTRAINQNQADALYSFIYNFGITKFKKSTLLKRINEVSSEKVIGEQFMRWVYVDGKPFEGLRKRRLEEFNLFNSKI